VLRAQHKEAAAAAAQRRSELSQIHTRDYSAYGIRREACRPGLSAMSRQCEKFATVYRPKSPIQHAAAVCDVLAAKVAVGAE